MNHHVIKAFFDAAESSNFAYFMEDKSNIPNSYRNTYPSDALPDARHIRLIRLWTSDSRDQLYQQLYTVPLDKAPDYVALSYHWGTTYRKDRFLGFKVTDNLYSALVNLAGPEPRLWWIDALCINQEDPPEKNEQIKLIREIYRKAKTVYVWLGKPCRVTFELLSNIYNRVGPEEIMRETTGYESGILERVGLPKSTDPSWWHLMKFIARPYFSRIWVAQELAAAGAATGNPKVMVACGRIRFNWVLLAGSVQWIHTRLLHGILRAPHTNPLPSEALSKRGDVITLGILVRRSDQHTWTDLLILSSKLDSTDPRDKIIALAGMVSEQDDSLAGFAFDYRQPVADLYCQVTGTIVTHDCSLELLTLVPDCSQRKIPGLPSWVPDFSSKGYVNRFRDNFSLSSKNKISNLLWHRSLSILSFDGLLLDQVENVAAHVHTHGTPLHYWRRWFTFFAQKIAVDEWHLLFSLANRDSKYQALEQFWRCLISNQIFGENPAPEAYRDNFATALFGVLYDKSGPGDWVLYYCITLVQNLVRQGLLHKVKNDPLVIESVRLYWNNLDKLQEVPRWWVLPDAWVSLDSKDQLIVEPPGDAMAFLMNMQQKIIDTRFFITRAGRVGRGPVSLRIGDRIAVAKGSSQVFILRKALRYYRLIGECYVGGLMQGEAHGDDSGYERISLI